MKKDSLLVPLMRTIDKLFFGIEDYDESEKQPEFCDSECEEEFDTWNDR